jgi:hypothetical protein
VKDTSTTSVASNQKVAPGNQSAGLTSNQWQAVQLGLTGLSQYQNSQLAASGAKSARMNAAIARRRGEFDLAALQNQQERMQAASRATLAARGVDTSTGSGLDFLADQAAQAEFNEVVQRNMTDDQVASFLAQAADYDRQSDYARWQSGVSTILAVATLL